MKIVFMGTPLFAVPTLKMLIKNFNVCAVVTKVDKPNKRGNKIAFSDVKKVALENNIEVFQPKSIKSEESYNKLNSYDADIFIVVAYGQILPQKVLDLPKLGCINIHGSILPKYRGPAPIHYAILNGDKETGVTIMYMDKGMDTGDIIKIKKMKINEDDTSGTLHDKMCELGADTLFEVLTDMKNNIFNRVKQNNDEATYCKLINKSDGHINFDNDTKTIINTIRAMTPFPGAYTILNNEKYKIIDSFEYKEYNNGICGEIVDITKDKEIVVKTKDGSIAISKIQKQGKKVLTSKNFLLGNKLEIGLKFS